ncbi:ester cyclase [Flavobacteriaceae bacterium KMM 6897]|nr:ester cyclase [Flavobacteriaceae bacterium KMM 6897]MEB8346236.1 ester cyclase [Flavobacteriaceae bacterium KMM 6898]
MKPLLTFYMLLLFLGFSCNGIVKQMEQERKQTEQIVKTNIETYITSCWNQKDVEALEAITTSDFVRNLNGIKVVASQNEMQAHINVFAKGFPDMEVALENMYLIEDKAFLKWHFTGLNSGVYGEFPPTHKKVKIDGLSRMTFDKQGILINEDTYFNELSLLQQLGYHLSPPDHKTDSD